MKIRGIVTNVVHYGAFIQLEEGIDGLIHISEMPTASRDVLPSAIVNKADEVEVTVIKISKDSKRISLSMVASLPILVEDLQSPPTPDLPVPKEKIEEAIPSDLPEPITITPTEHTEDTLPVSSFDGETNTTASCEPVSTTDIQPVGRSVDTSHSGPKEFSDILNSQIQNLKPEIIETETPSESSKATNTDSDTTLQKSKEVLKEQIQNLKPALPDENTGPPVETTNNIPSQSTEFIDSKPLEKMSNSPLSTEASREDVQKDENQDQQRNPEHHLRKFGRFVLRKLKQK